jgi:hypothetical protein
LQKALDNGFRVSYLGSFLPSRSFDPEILRRCTHAVDVAVERIGACLIEAQRIHAADPLIAALSFTEMGMESAAVIATALGIKGLELGPVVLTRYKDLMRAALSASPDLALPWKRAHDEQQLRAFYEQHGPAIIVKPITGLGSVGVQQIKSERELNAYLESGVLFPPEGLQAEQLADSDLVYSVETLTVDGQHHAITMSASRVTGYPYSLATHTMVPPPNLTSEKQEAIISKVRRFLDVIRLNNGVAHTEVKVTADGNPVIIESQTRVGGDRIWRMLEITTGIKQIDLALNALKGAVAFCPHVVRAKAAVFLSILPPPGRVKHVRGGEYLAEHPAVIEWSIDVAVGTEVAPIRDNMARKGYIVLQAADHTALTSYISAITQHVRIEYEDGTCWAPTYMI